MDSTAIPILSTNQPAMEVESIDDDKTSVTDQTPLELTTAAAELQDLQAAPDPKIRAAKRTKLKPWSQTKVLCKAKSSGLFLLTPCEKTQKKATCLAAQGVMDITTDRPLYILIGNFSDKEIILQKKMHVADAQQVPMAILKDEEPATLKTYEFVPTETLTSDSEGNEDALHLDSGMKLYFVI